MIGKFVVIDTLENFKSKLSSIPSSAIVLIKDVGQIYAHGTYFGAHQTNELLNQEAAGLAPAGGINANGQISNVDSEWVLTVTNGKDPVWKKLPANAFSNNSSSVLEAATTSDLGGIKVGSIYNGLFSTLTGKHYTVNIDSAGLAYVSVPWDFTDQNVKQTSTSLLNEEFSLLFSHTADDETHTEGTRKASNLKFNPSTGTLTTTILKGNLDGSYINKLTGYSKASTKGSISTNDSLNTALGKLEYKADVAYDLVDASKPNSTTIDTLREVLNVLSGITDTQTIQGILGNYLPITGGTLTSHLTINNNGTYGLFLKNTTGNSCGIQLDVKDQQLSAGILIAGGDWGVVTLNPIAGYKGIGVLDDGTPYFGTSSNKNTLWHSGNFNPGDYVTLASNQSITGDKKFNKKLTVYTTATNQTPKIVFDEYYSTTQGNWISEIISDYYGTNVCTTEGFTHGLYVVLGRGNPFDNLNILDSTKTPIARISKDRGHYFSGTMQVTGDVTLGSDVQVTGNLETSLRVRIKQGQALEWIDSTKTSCLLLPRSSNSYRLDYYNGTGWSWILDSSNYSSYALPLSGGTITGNLKVNGSLSFGGTDSTDTTSIFAENPSSTQSHLVFYMTDDSNDGFVFRSKIYGTDTPYDILKIYQSGIQATQPFSTTSSITTDSTLQVKSTASFATNYNGKAAVSIGANYIAGNGSANILDSQGNWVILGSGVAASGWTTYIDGNEIRLRYGTSHTLGLLIDSSGNTSISKDAIISGKLGVGVSPSYRLQIKESATDNLFYGECSNTVFKMHNLSFANYLTTNGGYVMYPGAGTTEAVRLEVLNKDGSWKGKGFTLYQNGNMTIGGSADNGNKLNVEGKFRVSSTTTLDNQVTINGPQNALVINSSASTAYAQFINMINPNMSATNHTALIAFGYNQSAYNIGYIGFKFEAKDSKSNMLTMGLHSVDHVLNITGNGNVGIGTTSPAYKLDVTGSIRATSQFISTVAGGTAPFSVTSTTKVTNLNADYWDNFHSYLGIPYATKYTKTGTGTWYLKISTAAQSHSIDTIIINTAGDNCSGNYVINSGSRSTNFWGYGVNYNNGGLLGVYKKITNSCDIYIKVNNPIVYIYTTFSATITEESVDDTLYTPVPGSNGLFCNYINDLSFKVTSSPGTDSRTIYFVT